MKQLILFFYLIALILLFGSCANKSITKHEYIKTDIESLNQNPQRFDGQYVKVEGYIIGNEFLPSKKDLSLLILAISNEAHTSHASPNQIIFPGVKHKIRAGEDGYNHAILEKCNKLSLKSMSNLDKVTIYGQFKPRQSYFQYDTGITLNITQIKFKDETIYSDYNDKSAFAHEAPGVMRKVYEGGKKLLKATGKAF